MAAAASQAQPADAGARTFPRLRLDRLVAERPRPPESARNPFRFGPTTEITTRRTPPHALPPGAHESPSGGSHPGTAAAPATAGPDAPAADATPLRLIGVVEPPGSTGPVAVLTDERGVYHGGVGDAVEGRYRILSITQTSVELTDLMRGARITLGLSGL